MHVADRALVGHLALDALGHQLERVLDVLLEVAVGRAARHRADRAHAAIGLVGAALPAGTLRPGVSSVPASSEPTIAMSAPAASALARSPEYLMPPSAITGASAFLRRFHRIHDRGELRHADAGDDARGADRAGPMPTLIASAPASISACAPSFVAMLPAIDLHGVGKLLDAVDRVQHAGGMAVRGVDHDAGRRRRRSARSVRSKPLVADRGGRGHAQPALLVLAGVRMGDRLFDILDGDQADAAILVVDHQQLFDAVLVQHPLRLVLADALAHRDQVFLRHQLRDLLARIGGEAHIAVGEDADQLAGRARCCRRSTTGMPEMPLILHQRQRVRQHRVRADGQRVDHHAGFELLDLPDLRGLLLRRRSCGG